MNTNELYKRTSDHIADEIAEKGKNFLNRFSSTLRVVHPRNFTTGNYFSGLNTYLLINSNTFTNPNWGTLPQWNTAGGRIMEGRKATHVFSLQRDDNAQSGFKPSSYQLYNYSQIEGVDDKIPNSSVEPKHFELDKVIGFVNQLNTRVTPTEMDNVRYDYATDTIYTPDHESSLTDQEFAASLIEAVVQWSGHKTRQNRLGSEWTREEYAREQFIVTVAVAVLCAEFNITPRVHSSPHQYTNQWIDLIHDDYRAVQKIFSSAYKAVAYLDQVANKQQAA